jgi:hypothetical protein
VTLPTEAMRRNNRPGMTWSVIDRSPTAATASSRRRGGAAADNFSVGDFWPCHKVNEIDDGGNIGDRPVDFSGFLNGETTSSDVVVWYRTGGTTRRTRSMTATWAGRRSTRSVTGARRSRSDGDGRAENFPPAGA